MELQKYEGDVYLAPIKDGVNQGLIGPLECVAFQPKREEGEEIKIVSKGRGTYGQTKHSEIEAGTALLAMSFQDIPSELLGLAFAADPAALTFIAGAVVDEIVPVAKAGVFYKLAKQNVKTSPVPVVTRGATTYVVTIDYTIDFALGMIKPVAGGAIDTDIAAAQVITPGVAIDLEVSYSYDAFDGESFNGETVSSAKFQVIFDGQNRVSKKDMLVEYYEVTIKAPADGLDLMSSEFITLELEGTAITPTGKTSPSKILRKS